jgi:hypothetical protein
VSKSKYKKEHNSIKCGLDLENFALSQACCHKQYKLTRFKNAKGIFIRYSVPAASICTIFGNINDTMYTLHAPPNVNLSGI